MDMLQKGYIGDSQVHDDIETEVELIQGPAEEVRVDYGGCCNNES